MSAGDQIDKLLKEHGAVLKRNAKHEVWELPNGQKFTRSQTPSDRKSDLAHLTDLKRALGITKTEATAGERRVRKLTDGKAEAKTKFKKSSGESGLAEKLQANGIVERAKTEQMYKDDIELLKDRLATYEMRLGLMTTENETLFNIGNSLKERLISERCWWCKFKIWFRHFIL